MKIPYGQTVSFAITLTQLFYGISQLVFGALALKKTNAGVLALGTAILSYTAQEPLH